MKIRLIGLGGGKNTRGTKKPSYKRSKSAPPGFGGALEESNNYKLLGELSLIDHNQTKKIFES